MNKEDLYEAIGDIGEDYIKSARTQKRSKSSIWLKWTAAAACLCCLCIVSIFAFGMYLDSLPHKGTSHLLNGIEGEIIDIVDERHCVIKIEHGAGAMGKGDTAHVLYESIIKNGERYSGKLAVGNTVSVTYYGDQVKIENGQSIIRVDSIELLTDWSSPVN